MTKEVVSDKQGISMIVMYIVGTSVIIISGLDAKQDIWLANILALFMALPIILTYARLHFLFPDKNLFDVFEFCLGKYVGKVFTIFYIWFSFHLCSLILRDFGEFYITVAAPKTSILIPMVIVAVLGAWIVKEGLEVMGRWAEFFLPIIILFLATAIILLVPQMDINNIQPVLYEGLKPVIKGAFSTLSFPLAEIITFTTVFSSFRTNKSPYRIYIYGLLIGGIVVLFNSAVNILVLGPNIATDMYFPMYATVSKLNVGEFLQRLQILVAFAFLLGGFIKLSVCLLASSIGITKLFGFSDYRFIVMPLSLLLIGFSYLIFDNLMDMLEWSMKIWPYYAFFFQAILPIIIYIIAEIKVQRSKVRTQS